MARFASTLSFLRHLLPIPLRRNRTWTTGQMFRAEAEAIIPLAPDELWELMRDVDRRPRWDASVKRVKRARPSPSEETERLYFTAPLFLGLTWSWEGEYVSFKGPQTSAVKMVKGSLLRPFSALVGTWLLAPREEGTNLRLIVSFKPRIGLPLSRILATYRVKTILARTLRDLRAEATAPGSKMPGP